MAIQDSHKRLWWSSLVQQLKVWCEELHHRCLWESWICYYFTLQKFILEFAFDKLEKVYKCRNHRKEINSSYTNRFFYKNIKKVISKKFHLGCCLKNVQRKNCAKSFWIGYPIFLNKYHGCSFQQWPQMTAFVV